MDDERKSRETSGRERKGTGVSPYRASLRPLPLTNSCPAQLEDHIRSSIVALFLLQAPSKFRRLSATGVVWFSFTFLLSFIEIFA